MIKYLNQDKWERAKKAVADPNDEGAVLDAYVKLGGVYEGELDCHCDCEPKEEEVKPKRTRKKKTI